MGVLVCPEQEAGCVVLPVFDGKEVLYTLTLPAVPAHKFQSRVKHRSPILQHVTTCNSSPWVRSNVLRQA